MNARVEAMDRAGEVVDASAQCGRQELNEKARAAVKDILSVAKELDDEFGFNDASEKLQAACVKIGALMIAATR